VGLATARELLRRRPGTRLAVLEKEPEAARHQTGHNSGVIHTGVYYRPESLKAQLCVEGRAKLLRFCHERRIPYRLDGKLIIALDERERVALDELRERGLANGVEGLEIVPREAIREREPHAAGLAALWVPGAGTVDYRAVAAAIANEVVEHGGTILMDHGVRAILREGGGLRVETEGGTLVANRLIACAGLQCDRVAALSTRVLGLRIIPFRGDYHLLRPEARALVRSMIYPVPDPRYPFLGVHLTRRLDGEVWAGPNAVLALAREGYGRLDFALRDAASAAMWPGLWRIVARHWRTGLGELWRDWVKGAYARELARYVPELCARDLLPGPSGIRAQAVARDGSFVEDFAMAVTENAVHVLNAPSPAATSAFAIARELVDRADRALGAAPSRESRV